MRQTGEAMPIMFDAASKSRDDLEAICVAVRQLREDLLDYNPVLAIMAEALQRAVELEIESRRCNLLDGEND